MLKLLIAGGLVVILGFTFGPPKYVAFVDHQKRIETLYGEHDAYLAWHINRWVPLRSFAELVWYAPSVDSEQALTELEIKQAAVPFSLPGSWFSNYIWWLLPPLLWGGQRLFSFAFFAWRQVRSHQRNFFLSERRNTIIAYETFLKQTQDVPYKPYRLRRKAKHAREQLYDLYIESLMRASMNDDERVLNGVVAKMLAFNRDHNQRFLPLQLHMEAGFKAQMRGALTRFSKFEGYFEERMSQSAKQWLLEVHGSGVPSMSELYEDWDGRARNCAKAILTARKWQPLTALRESFRDYAKDTILRVLEKAASARNRDDLARFAEAYLTFSVYRYLPVDAKLRDYEQDYKRLIGKRIAQVLSAYFPQEITTNGVKPDLFLNPSFRHDSHMAKLSIELVFENKVMPDGMPVVSNAFYISMPGEEPQRLEGLEHKLSASKEKEHKS
ncbi:hypothetical protein [Pseudidiomarina gelatinasegens]|uniref:hypothetical protein n=1 Tax=Pseudidiomarina gelatinasegens TaxID=2487740 RepID=UPI003A986E2C